MMILSPKTIVLPTVLDDAIVALVTAVDTLLELGRAGQIEILCHLLLQVIVERQAMR